MSTLFNVDLEEVSQVVEGRAVKPQMSLLLDRGGVGVSLRDDEATQVCAVLAGHFLPCRLTLVVAEIHRALTVRGAQEDTPTIIGHLDVIKVRPAARMHA